MVRNNIRKRPTVFLYILSLVILVAVLTGCQSDVLAPATTETTTGPTETTAPTAIITDPTASSLPYNTWFTMGAVLVNDQGEVKETMELSVNVMIWEQEGRGNYSLRFFYPENIHNSGGGVLPYPEDENAYTCSFGISTETGLQGRNVATYYVGFDSEKECFIVDFDDGEDVYLIAYRSPDADISALWLHFQDFITMRPDSFPTVIG